jgi:hypothetical protein
MTDFSDFTASLADWANRQDWSQTLLTSFVRDAESKLNAELRIDRMICQATNNVTQGCAPLPDDWLESDFMLIASGTTPSGWRPIRYEQRDRFFKLPVDPYSASYEASSASTTNKYTIEGRTIYFGGPVDDIEGTQFQLNYYAEVPVFSDTVDSWVYTKFPSLYRYAALMHADLHAVGEEQTAGLMKQLAEDIITKLNANHQHARASGSLLARGHRRSFG